MSLLEAYVVMFIASFCSLVIEMVAGRILAPFVGVSIYTWTSIIGVILAGISIGAYIGGIIVDRFPARKTLGILLLLSGLAVLTIIPLTDLVAAHRFPLSLMWRIFAVTAIIFFIPGCILGTISPVVVRLTLKNVERAGNVVGKIYAVSTLGAIIGTFVTGFVLISLMGTRPIILSMGALLIVVAAFVGALFKARKTQAIFVVVVFVLFSVVYSFAYKPRLDDRYYYYKESDYYTIKLAKTQTSDGKTLRALILDNLIHSYVCLEDPTYIEYEYERIYAEVMKWRFDQNTAFKSLSIGGGGYTFPRYMEITYPKAHIDVVEIDPTITKVVYDQLGLPRTTRITTYNTDGRWYVMNCTEKYDVIFTDAFNDLSIPYHLTTREFVTQLKSVMTPDGILISNIIDNFQRGAFLPSYMKTLQGVFGEKNVYLLSVSPDFENLRISTFIVMASYRPLDMAEFDTWLKNNYHSGAKSAIVSDALVQKLLANPQAIVIRDDYAPVDNLIAPVFEERFGYNRKGR
ncbi:MAG TPA: fused MFS/spermidine synthase [Syntrophorhabdales bacterium]|nr:fused MFS/spermidine synthase [Syntrophorhabdales bacterium]